MAAVSCSVLTFGTSALLDNHQKAAQQRQTAIMSVYDIDEIIRLVMEDMEKEKALSEISVSMLAIQASLNEH